MNRREFYRNHRAEKEIRAFLTAGPPVFPEKERKQKNLELLYQERKRLRLAPRQSYGKRVLNQAAYLSPLAWVIQGGIVLLIGWSLRPEAAGDQRFPLLLAACAPLLGMVGITEILRSYQENVWELEQACRYNLRQLMGMRLLIFGIVDTWIALLVLLGGIRAGICLEELLVFFLIPQLLSDCVYLRLMSLFRRRFQGIGLLGMAVAVTFLWLWIAEWMATATSLGFLQPAVWRAWIYAVSLGSAGLLVLCCVKFLRGVDKEEERWNFGWTA